MSKEQITPGIQTSKVVDREAEIEATGLPAEQQYLAIARTRLKLAEEAEGTIRNFAVEDLKFSNGDQWPDEIQNQRSQDHRPVLVINKLGQMVKQVTNDQRQNRPAMKVSPVDSVADPEVAEVLQGIFRHIEVHSNADVAYDIATDFQVRQGWGYYRILTQYESPTSFDQDILIKPIKNPYSIYFDPSAQEIDYSDARWCFVTDFIPISEFKDLYPNSELVDTEIFSTMGNQAPGWATKDAIRIAEYFWKEMVPRDLVKLASGVIMFAEQIPDTHRLLPEFQVVQTRKTHVPQVHWDKINGVERLEETMWPVPHIPVIPVLGEEVWIDGERTLKGLVRDAKDPQRMLNYWRTATTEMIALAPKAPWVAAEGQLEGHEEEWKQANVRNLAVLQYKPISVSGQPVPPPQRNVAEQPIQAMVMASQLADSDMKAVTSIYDASLGAKSNETSGRAIVARQQRGELANFNFIDNLSRSIRYAGTILLELVPIIYSPKRVARIIGEDEKPDEVSITTDSAQPAVQEKADSSGKIQKIYNLGVGKYDVVISIGPSYLTKRQEAFDQLTAFVNAYPALMQVAGDLIFENADTPGAAQIAKRLKNSLPPGIDDDEPQLPPEVVEQLQQLQTALQQVQGELDKKTRIIEGKVVESTNAHDMKMAEIASEERLAGIRALTELVKVKSKEGQVIYASAAEALLADLEALRRPGPVEGAPKTPVSAGTNGT